MIKQLKYQFFKFLLLSVVLFSFFSCEKKKYTDNTLLDKSILLEEDSVLSMYNSSDKTISFRLDINQQIAASIDELVAKVRELPNESENESEIRKTWRFVATSLDFFQPISTSKYLDIPLQLYNSTGYGHCDDFCILMNAILKKMGYQTKVTGVNNHVVLEVLNNDRWEMYDPFLFVYYINKEGKIASIEDLKQDPLLITNPVHKLQYRNLNSAEKKIRYLSSYSQFAADFYINCSPYTYYTKNYFNDSFKIEIPPHASIEFPVESPDPIYKNASNGKVAHPTYIKYTLPKNWTGKFNIPFLVSSIRGTGAVKIHSQVLHLNNFIAKMDYTTASSPISKTLEILNSNSEIVIYGLINENFFMEKNLIEFNIGMSDFNQMSIKICSDEERYSKIFSPNYVEKNTYRDSEILSMLHEDELKLSKQLLVETSQHYNIKLMKSDIMTLMKIKGVSNLNERATKILIKLDQIHKIETEKNIHLIPYNNFNKSEDVITFTYFLDEYPTDEIIRLLKNTY